MVGHVIAAAVAREHRSRRGRGRGDGLRHAAGHHGDEHRAQGRDARRASGDGRRHHHRSQCASGLQAIAVAARSVMFDGVEVAVGGGGEFDQPGAERPHEQVSCGRSRTAGDEGRHVHRDAGYGRNRRRSATRSPATSGRIQPRMPAPHRGGAAGRPLQRRMAPIKTKMAVIGQGDQAVSYKQMTLSADEGPRPETTAEGLASVKPVSRAGYDHRAATPASSRTAQRLRHHERQARRQEGPEATRHLPRLRRGGLSSPTKWASVRSAAFRGC